MPESSWPGSWGGNRRSRNFPKRWASRQKNWAAALESGVEVESIYKTIYRGDGSDICLIDRLTDEKNFQEQIMDEMLLDQLMQDLPEEHRRLIELRYYKELTQTQVAEELGISQVQVSRQEKKILQAMRANAHGRNCK